MPAHRQITANSRRRPATRLVKVRATAHDTSEDLLGYRNGVTAAHLLRHHFPDFYSAHVAHRPATPHVLLGVADAFCTLAEMHLLHFGYGSLSLKDIEQHPTVVLDRYLDAKDPLMDLFDEFEHFLWFALPDFYGIGSPPYDDEESELPDVPLVALTFWIMAQDTAWKMMSKTAIDRVLTTKHPDVVRFLTLVPRLPPTLDMAELCRYLNRIDILGQTDLGSIFAYCFGRTGNMFADYTSEEMYDNWDYNDASWWSSTDTFAYLRAEQDEAFAWSERFWELEHGSAVDLTQIRRIVSIFADAEWQVKRATYNLPDIVQLPLLEECFYDQGFNAEHSDQDFNAEHATTPLAAHTPPALPT